MCLACGTRRTYSEEFTDLSVSALLDNRNIPAKLHECLERFVKRESLEGYACEKCGVRDTSCKSTIVKLLPNVSQCLINKKQTLCLHVTRTDHYGTNSRLDFPLKGLDMTAFSLAKDTSIYDLYSCIVHINSSNVSGHFISYTYVQDPGDGESAGWFRLDDSTITPTTADCVKSLNPYLLFYVRREESWDEGSDLSSVERESQSPEPVERVSESPEPVEIADDEEFTMPVPRVRNRKRTGSAARLEIVVNALRREQVEEEEDLIDIESISPVEVVNQNDFRIIEDEQGNKRRRDSEGISLQSVDLSKKKSRNYSA